MSDRVLFEVPQTMTKEMVARAFAAYLAAPFVQYAGIPHPKEEDDDSSWQLDLSNNFWLHFNGDRTAWLNCRYVVDKPLLQSMVAVFRLRHAQ